MKKKGFFFSMDAFLALILFGTFLALIYSYYVSNPKLDQPFYFSEDVLDVFSNVKINELDLNQYPVTNNLIATGVITNPDKTIFEVLIELNNKDPPDIDDSRVMVEELVSGIIPKQYGFSLEFNQDGIQDGIYNKDPSKQITNAIARQRIIIG